MKFNKQLIECLKTFVLKDFVIETKDLGGACILGASLQIYNHEEETYIDFINQDEVCEAQGEIAILNGLTKAEKITNQLFPSLKTNINYGELD